MNMYNVGRIIMFITKHYRYDATVMRRCMWRWQGQRQRKGDTRRNVHLEAHKRANDQPNSVWNTVFITMTACLSILIMIVMMVMVMVMVTMAATTTNLQDAACRLENDWLINITKT